MEQLFLNTVKEAAEKLKNKLVDESFRDYIATANHNQLTPTETLELVNKAITLHLAQELHYRLTFNH